MLLDPIVIVGGGHAAAQLCAGLVKAGAGPVELVCEEDSLPYHRPPLSKGFLKGGDAGPPPHRLLEWYGQAGVALHLADAAVSIDRQARTLLLRSGKSLSWRQLVLATGARPRPHPVLAGPLDNVVLLRAAREAIHLRDRLAKARNVMLIGGGFIGLEVASTALALGKAVTVLEAGPRLLGRAASPELSAYVLAAHRLAGMDIRLNVSAPAFQIEAGRVVSVQLAEGSLPVDLVVVGIGAVPETTLASSAGLACADGIVVDAFMRTSDPDILAVGDCARFPDRRTGHSLRLESVQNANDQARTAVATLTGAQVPHGALPRFWSEQGGLKLCMAGLMPAEATHGHVVVRRADEQARSLTLIHFVEEQLVCLESANVPLDQALIRKLTDLSQ